MLTEQACLDALIFNRPLPPEQVAGLIAENLRLTNVVARPQRDVRLLEEEIAEMDRECEEEAWMKETV